MVLLDDTKEEILKEPQDSLSGLLKNYDVKPEKIKNIKIEVKQDSGFAYWMKTLLPFLIPFLFIGIFIYIMMRQVQGANTRAMGFGKSGAKETPKNAKLNFRMLPA